MANSDTSNPFASRGGLKLDAVLEAISLDVQGFVAVDLGSATGGFVDVLLRRGVARVYAVEKGFGRLEWRLRNDPRVVVLERTDATRLVLPERADVVTIDLGFTRQLQILPLALQLLSPRGQIVSLLKPQYEASGHDLEKGKLTAGAIDSVVARTLSQLEASGIIVNTVIPSAVRGKDAKVQEFFLIITAPQARTRA
jgi:23S rRNA (cytidine1920-2'-O)/16S rRNA (cytidine1409-2'-O)-methyltransferase